MTKDKALKLALEALEKSHICPLLPDDCAEAITAIKEALAQPERPWARLTLQEQIDICTNWDQSKGWGALYKAIDQALKEKNT